MAWVGGFCGHDLRTDGVLALETIVVVPGTNRRIDFQGLRGGTTAPNCRYE
jgi:hypothetical protein